MVYDRRLQEVSRNLQLEPTNADVRRLYETLLCRIHGRECLAGLNDLVDWDASSIELQDAIAAHVLIDLGNDWRGIHAITVDKQLGQPSNSSGSTADTRRICRFEHKPSQIIVHLIPGGAFTLGSTSIFEASPPQALKMHPLLVGYLPVLQSQWDAIGGHDQRKWTNSELPIEGISYKDILAWLKASNAGFRLPSEAEWEYACRAGSTTNYYWGDSMDDRYCWHKRNSGGKTHPPSKHRDSPNQFGLVDTLGNVYEMCADRYFPDYHGTFPEDGQPRGGEKGTYRVRRGGSWAGESEKCQSAYRAPYPRWKAVSTLGFRVFLSVNC